MTKSKITENQNISQPIVIAQESFLARILPTPVWSLVSFVSTKTQGTVGTLKAAYQNLPTIWDAKDLIYTKVQNTVGIVKSTVDTIKTGYKHLPKLVEFKNTVGSVWKISSVLYNMLADKKDDKKVDLLITVEQSDPDTKTITKKKVLQYKDLTLEELVGINDNLNHLLPEEEGADYKYVKIDTNILGNTDDIKE
jgi:hypothetical protein